jgi:hypothetical protein
MPTFCRHNRFLERCPICSKTLPDQAESPGAARRAPAARGGAKREGARRRTPRAESVRIRREGRAQDDGYRSPLVPGLRASADAIRLAEEIAFSSARLSALSSAPPDLYGEVRDLAAADLERATWASFLIAYLSPLEGDDPFGAIRQALAASPTLPAAEEMPDLREIPRGPRGSHEPARGAETLIAYSQWVQRSAQAQSPAGAGGGPAVSARAACSALRGSQAVAFVGDAAWSEERRFERLFERLALPGFARMGRYDLLVTLGYLGLYELRPGSLHLAGARGLSAEDPTTLAAKRLFSIGDPLLLERRAAALAKAAEVPVETLDLALGNWGSTERATLGFPPGIRDEGALERSREALGV